MSEINCGNDRREEHEGKSDLNFPQQEKKKKPPQSCRGISVTFYSSLSPRLALTSLIDIPVIPSFKLLLAALLIIHFIYPVPPFD